MHAQHPKPDPRGLSKNADNSAILRQARQKLAEMKAIEAQRQKEMESFRPDSRTIICATPQRLLQIKNNYGIK